MTRQISWLYAFWAKMAVCVFWNKIEYQHMMTRWWINNSSREGNKTKKTIKTWTTKRHVYSFQAPASNCRHTRQCLKKMKIEKVGHTKMGKRERVRPHKRVMQLFDCTRFGPKMAVYEFFRTYIRILKQKKKTAVFEKMTTDTLECPCLSNQNLILSTWWCSNHCNRPA